MTYNPRLDIRFACITSFLSITTPLLRSKTWLWIQDFRDSPTWGFHSWSRKNREGASTWHCWAWSLEGSDYFGFPLILISSF